MSGKVRYTARSPFIPIATTEDLSDPASWVNQDQALDDTEYNEFFKSMGEAIAAWGMVETRLQAVLLFAVATRESAPISAMFGSANGFRARLDMTAAAVEASSIGKLVRKEWATAKAALVTASKSRNKLAHHTVFYDFRAPAGRRLFLAPGNNDGVTSRLHAQEIQALGKNYGELSVVLYDLWCKMLERARPK